MTLELSPGRGANRTFEQTVVGMSSIFVHNNDALYKDALTFNPERWLGPDSKGLDTWLVPFSRGPRSCLGLK